MITYQEARQELKKTNKSLKYFTQDFYNLYVHEHLNGFKNIFTTDFYNKNSTAYCEFLSIFTDHLPTYILYGYIDAWQKEKICTVSAENEVKALKMVKDFKECYK